MNRDQILRYIFLIMFFLVSHIILADSIIGKSFSINPVDGIYFYEDFVEISIYNSETDEHEKNKYPVTYEVRNQIHFVHFKKAPLLRFSEYNVNDEITWLVLYCSLPAINSTLFPNLTDKVTI